MSGIGMEGLRMVPETPESTAQVRPRRVTVGRLLGGVVVALGAWSGGERASAAPPEAAAAQAAPADDLEALQEAFDLRAEATRLASQGNVAAAVAKADEALALVEGNSPLARQFRAALLDTRALAHLHAGDQEKLAADSLAAAEIWRGLGAEQAESLAGSLLNAGFALIQTKQLDDATAALVAARDLLAAEPARRDARLLHALSLLSTAAGEAADRRLATDALADYVRLAADLGRRGDKAFAIHLRLLGIRLLAERPSEPGPLDAWVDGVLAVDITADDAEVIGQMVAKLVQAGDVARSMRLASRLVEWHRDQRPPDPLRLAAALDQVGKLAVSTGDFAAARRSFREACSLLEDGPPREHAIALIQLAGLSSSPIEHLEAEADFATALDRLATLPAPDEVLHALALGGLGMVNLQLGDTARARTRIAEAVQRAEAVGESAAAVTGNLLVRLAMAEAIDGDIKAARTSFARGRELTEAAFGPDHPMLLVFDQGGAGLEMQAGGDTAIAKATLARVIERLGRMPGGGGLILAQAFEMLAESHHREGDRDRALALLAEARTIREARGDDRSLVFVRTLLQTAEVRGLDDPASRADVERALDLCDALLGPAFVTLSERQQIAAAVVAHRALGVAVSLPARADSRGEAALYGRMLRWKGAIFARQHEIRRALSDPRAAAVADELRDVAARIAAATLQPGSAADGSLAALTDRRDSLERSLAEAAGGSSRSDITTAAVAASLPPEAVLVDFLEYVPGGTGEQQPMKRLVTFVLRRGREVVRVDLGAAAAVREALAAWRPWQADRPADAHAAANLLRRLVWLPLEPHLADATVVLVSPDGSLGELPFAALPGSTPDSVLLDELLIAHVPVPSLLPTMLARPRPAGRSGTMLLVGGVEFGPPPARTTPGLAVAPDGFPDLPGTEREVETIAALAGSLEPPIAARQLVGGAATSEAVQTGLTAARFVHLATHGFFAETPAGLTDGLSRGIAGTAALELAGPGPAQSGDGALGGCHPGALSGLALAGVNGRAADGILTAIEVADLDLGGADLVVLSACDTRRGRQAAGEGLLGLQRAFEVAGARTVVASLWQVDDDATAVLMQEFYANLWRRGLPTGEALRQAQQHVARTYRGAEGSDPAASRGVAGSEKRSAGGRIPPAFWAGFVLSGDWR